MPLRLELVGSISLQSTSYESINIIKKSFTCPSDPSSIKFDGSKLFVASSISSDVKIRYGGSPTAACFIACGICPTPTEETRLMHHLNAGT